MTAHELLSAARRAGVDIRPDGEHLRVRPADRLTPSLRAALIARKADVLAALRPPRAFVTLRPDARTGLAPVLPVEAILVALDLEARGILLRTDADHQLIVPADAPLTAADRAAVARWRHHLAAIVEYEAPRCA